MKLSRNFKEDESPRRLAVISKIYKELDLIFQVNDAQANLWLKSPNKHLNGVPINKMRTLRGANQVLAYLHMFEQTR